MLKSLFVISFGFGLSGFTAYFAWEELSTHFPPEPMYYQLDKTRQDNMEIGLKSLTETLAKCRKTIAFNRRQYEIEQRNSELSNRKANQLQDRIDKYEAQNKRYQQQIIRQSKRIYELQRGTQSKDSGN